MGYEMKKFYYFIGALGLIFLGIYSNKIIIYYLTKTIKLISLSLKLFGLESYPKNNLLLVTSPNSNKIIDISIECSGILLLLLFSSICGLSPNMDFKKKLIGIPFISLLYLGNIVRVVINILFGFYFSFDLLTFFHNTIGNIMIFIWLFLLYFCWMHCIGFGFKKIKY